MNMKKHLTKRGFTLVEAMIAVTIITFAVAGPLFSASRAIVAAGTARDQLTAVYLAQEGIEYLRAMRDDEYLAVYNNANASSVAWTNFLTSSSAAQCRATVANPSQACSFDPVGTGGIPSLAQCSIGSCPPLYLANNGATNYYTTNSNATGATLTSFTRSIQIIDVPNTDVDKQIVSKVSWSFHGIPYSATVVEHLTPWQ